MRPDQPIHLGGFGIDLGRTREPAERIVIPLLIDEDAAQVHEALDVMRVDAQRLLEGLLGLREIAALPR